MSAAEDELKTLLDNQTKGKALITKMISKGSLLITEKSLLWKIFQHHPEAERKRVAEIKDITLILNPRKRREYTVKLIYRDGSEATISYDACIRNLFGKFNIESDLEKRICLAFRSASDSSAKRNNFFKSNTYKNLDNDWCTVCTQCLKESTQPHVDHNDPWPFSSILEAFLKSERIALTSVATIKTDTLPPRDELADDVLRERWIRFHDERVIYRMLCGPCNASNGCYGRRKRRR
jgi:hypothetical protein